MKQVKTFWLLTLASALMAMLPGCSLLPKDMQEQIAAGQCDPRRLEVSPGMLIFEKCKIAYPNLMRYYEAKERRRAQGICNYWAGDNCNPETDKWRQ